MNLNPIRVEPDQNEAHRREPRGSTRISGTVPATPPTQGRHPRKAFRPGWLRILLLAAVGSITVGTCAVACDRRSSGRRTDQTEEFVKAQTKTTRMKVERVLDAVQEYQADPDTKATGPDGCPHSLSVLVPERVKADMIKDAWNQPLKIACQGQKICIYSVGKNKRDENGGGDDIKACTEEAGEE